MYVCQVMLHDKGPLSERSKYWQLFFFFLFSASFPPNLLFSCETAINGYVFGNLPAIQLCQNRPATWHLFGMGNEEDIHSVFFHGNTLLDRGHRTDTVSLFPATFVTAQMVPRANGKWLLSCQVNDHLQGRVSDL